LSYTEEKNYKATIDSIKGIFHRGIAVEGFRKNNTFRIAKELAVEGFHIPFVNPTHQYQGTLSQIDIEAPWTFQFDGVQRITNDACDEIIQQDEPKIDGGIIQFEIAFSRNKLRYCGIYLIKKMIRYKTDKEFMKQS